MTARADLHVHSKHSSQPSEWILRRFRAPESYTEPLEIYRLCRERGMDFVTISDHDRRANGLVRSIFGSLTRGVLADLAERHRLEPMDATPWIKTFTVGSDDHGGFYIGTTWTQTPAAATVEEYLAHLRAGRHEPGGETGSSLRL